MRAVNLCDEDMQQICKVMTVDPANPGASNRTLKVLDVSYNPLTMNCMESIAEMMEGNRTVEYLGLAKLKMQNEDVLKMF